MSDSSSPSHERRTPRNDRSSARSSSRGRNNSYSGSSRGGNSRSGGSSRSFQRQDGDRHNKGSREQGDRRYNRSGARNEESVNGGSRNSERRYSRDNEDRYSRNRSSHSGGRRGGSHDRRGGERRDSRFERDTHKYGMRGGKDRPRAGVGGHDNRGPKGPAIPEGIEVQALPLEIRRELHMLSKENAERVALHMIAAYDCIGEDDDLALAHARAARDHAGRIGVVRENAGVVAYMTGNWHEALTELRTARRISGGPGLLSIMADCERGLGRPERAIEMWDGEFAPLLSSADREELRIVVAGAFLDIDDLDSALSLLESGDLNEDREGESAARYFYAYADALEKAGRVDEALTWFQHSLNCDGDSTDAAARIDQLQ